MLGVASQEKLKPLVLEHNPGRGISQKLPLVGSVGFVDLVIFKYYT